MKSKLSILSLIFLNIVWFESQSVTAQPNFTNSITVLTPGMAGEWDSDFVFKPSAIIQDSMLFLFYTGRGAGGPAIGYAASPLESFNFTKSASNPILTGDGSGFDAAATVGPAIMFDDSLWVLYYSGKTVLQLGPGQAIGRATATNPDGPWTRLQNPVLEVGSPGEWDDAFIGPSVALKVDSIYVMYYHAGSNSFPTEPYYIGMATSQDGINWAKYDDPMTASPPYAESDPVLLPKAGSWDSGLVWYCHVHKRSDIWEMLYSGGSGVSSSIGYATSTNGGILWDKHPVPIFTPPIGLTNVESPSVVVWENTHYMFYDLGINIGRIDVAIDNPPSFFIRLQPEDSTAILSPVEFSWSTSVDPLGSGMIDYMLHLIVDQIDTTYTVADTSMAIDFDQFGLPPNIYGVNWSVIASDGYLTTPAANGEGYFIWDNTVGIDDYSNLEQVREFRLQQNYPNPFNPGTTIRYTLPQRARATLKIYDVIGREITTLVDKELSAGDYQAKFDGRNLPSGIYFYRLNVQDVFQGTKSLFSQTRKLVLLK